MELGGEGGGKEGGGKGHRPVTILTLFHTTTACTAMQSNHRCDRSVRVHIQLRIILFHDVSRDEELLRSSHSNNAEAMTPVKGKSPSPTLHTDLMTTKPGRV